MKMRKGFFLVLLQVSFIILTPVYLLYLRRINGSFNKTYYTNWFFAQTFEENKVAKPSFENHAKTNLSQDGNTRKAKFAKISLE